MTNISHGAGSKSQKKGVGSQQTSTGQTTPQITEFNPYAAPASLDTGTDSNSAALPDIDIKRETWKCYGHILGIYSGAIGLIGSAIGLVNGLLATNSLSTALTASMFLCAFLSAFSIVKLDQSNKIINQARKQSKSPPNQ